MKNIKKKIFLLFLIILPLFLFFNASSYNIYSKLDTSSYISIKSWSGSIKSIDNIIKPLDIDKPYKIHKWSTIRTWDNKSFWIITWWDWSVTRLWSNTELKIDDNFVSENFNTINIDIKLLRWRVWTNFKSILWFWSYFKTTGWETIAAIRGTVFTMDIDNNYIDVLEHKVELTDENWLVKNILPWVAYSIDSLRQISLLNDFLNNEFDEKIINKLSNLNIDVDTLSDWYDLNREEDIKFMKILDGDLINKLRETNPFLNALSFFKSKYSIIKMIDKFEDTEILLAEINKLDKEDRVYVKNYLIYKYQLINFVWSDDNIFANKIDYKDLIIRLSDNKIEKEIYANSIAYDIEELSNNDTNSKNILDKVDSFLINNTESIDPLFFKNYMLEKWISGGFVDEWLNKILIDNFSDLKDTIMWIDANVIKNNITDWLDSLENTIHTWLDNAFWEDVESLKNILKNFNK